MSNLRALLLLQQRSGLIVATAVGTGWTRVVLGIAAVVAGLLLLGYRRAWSALWLKASRRARPIGVLNGVLGPLFLVAIGLLVILQGVTSSN